MPPNFDSRIIRFFLAHLSGLTQIVVGVIVTDGV